MSQPDQVPDSQDAGAGGADPFSPAGVAFSPISPRLITVRLIVLACWTAIPLLVGVALAVGVHPAFWALSGLAAAVGAWLRLAWT